jgi:hypothetical protein
MLNRGTDCVEYSPGASKKMAAGIEGTPMLAAREWEMMNHE